VTERAEVNPAHAVTVIDFSPETMASIVAHIEVSTAFEHFVYREAELDAIWSLTGFSLRTETDPATREAVHTLHQAAHRAHDLIGENRALGRRRDESRRGTHECVRHVRDRARLAAPRGPVLLSTG
jgi:hypothetical protein